MKSVVALLLLALALASDRRIPPCRAEFTVIMSDSSTLVDTPQTGFSDKARTDPNEQKAVYEIMKATGNGWATSIPDVCRGRWHGIECMPDKDEVYHIVSLSFGALSDDTAFPVCDQRRSFLSPAITKLPHIRSLFFYRCFSSNPQSIPGFIGWLGSTLRSLVLRENGHVGAIPAELGNLKSLTVLDLQGNSLSSPIPPSLAGLARLQLLDLSNNQLTGTVSHLDFPNLNVLDLNSNHLQGRIPPALGGCSSLIKMDLSKNRIMGPIPDTIGNLKSLILLDLSGNYLSGPIPDSLQGLSSLRALVLSGNSMSPSTIPSGIFTGLKNLEILLLSDTGLQGPIPASIGRILALRVLHLDGNNLSGSLPLSFRGLDKLSELRLNDNRLMGPLPFDKQTLWRMGRKLRVANNSGLCYHAGDVREESAATSSMLQGISCCEATRAAAMPAAAAAASSTARGRSARSGIYHP